MKKIIVVLLTLALLLGSATALVGCGKPEDKGAEISVYLGEEVYDFDPTEYYGDSNADALMNLLFEPLFRLDENGNVKNAAASGYRIDTNERTITIDLVETYWSDGKRVVADDYIYAWRNLILEPSNANPAAALFYDVENALAIKNGTKSIYDFGARASDVYQITVSYREGADPDRIVKNLASVAASPVREDIIYAAPTYWSKSSNTAVFNGPFKVSEINYEQGKFTVSRNEGYHQKLTSEDYTKYVTPYILNATFNVDGISIPVSYSDIENKTVFYTSEASLADRKANSANALVSDDLSVYSYVFNTEKPLFAIQEVRQALSLVIDRNSIISAITFGKAATGFIPEMVKDSATGNSFRGEALISAQANKAKAEELLSGVDLTGISKEFNLVINDDEESVAIAEIVKAAWESLSTGFTVNVVKLGAVETELTDVSFSDSGLQVLLNDVAMDAADFDVIAIDWQLYSTDAFVGLSAFSAGYSGMGKDFQSGATRNNISSWSDTEYDYAISKAYKAESDEVRDSELHKAEKILVDAAPIVPLVFNQNFCFFSEDISGITSDGFGNFVYDKMELANYKEYLDEQ